MVDKTPQTTPQSIDERLISLMIHRSQGAIQAFDAIKSSTYIEGEDNKAIFNAIKQVFENQKKKIKRAPALIDQDMVIGQLQANGKYDKIGAEKIDRIFSTLAHSSTFQDTVNLIVQRKKQQEKEKLHKQLKSTEDQTEIDEIVQKIHDLDKDIPSSLGEQIMSREDWMAEIDGIEILPECIPTGFPLLDQMMGGGFIKGNYHIIASPTGSGKTILMLSMWKHLLDKGIKSAYVNYEIPRDLFMKYLFAQFTGTNVYRPGGIPADELAESKRYFTEKVEELYDLGLLMIADPRSGTPKMWEDLEELVRYLREERGAEAIWFDTINSVTARTKKGQDLRWNEYESIAQSAEYLCGELGIPIIFSAQMDRDAGKRNKGQTVDDLRPQIGDVAGSKVLSEKAANIVHLFRADKADKSRMIDYSELVITKNRVIGQELGSRPIRVKYQSSYKRMVELPPEMQEAEKVILDQDSLDGTFITSKIPGVRKHPAVTYIEEGN